MSAFRPGPFALAVVLLLTCVAGAQTDPLNPPRGGEGAERVESLVGESLRAFEAEDYAHAEAVSRRLTELDGGNFVHWYNLACALAMQGETEEGERSLMRSVELGFTDVGQMRRDPHLAPLRETAAYRRISGNWPLILEKHRDANVERTRRVFRGAEYRTTFDESLRLAYHSAFDPASLEAARGELARIAGWAEKNVFPEILDAEAGADDAWVVVVLPTRGDFTRWAARTFGGEIVSGMNTLGGVYSHDEKRLVAMGLGTGLRHEFFHVLHWRDNVRRGVVHPVWVQEGLCSLVEDYDLEGDSLVPAPSWRTNAAVRLARIGKLMPIERLCRATRAQFHADRPLLHYAMARSLFLYFHQRGVLGEWYRVYNETFERDPTGILAIETVFARPLEAFEKEYRAWLRELEVVPEWNRVPDGFVQLGLRVNPGGGEGPIVEDVLTREAALAGFRAGDVITGINARPTRDVHELLRVLADYAPGDRVRVSYRRLGVIRREGGHETAELVLQRRR